MIKEKEKESQNRNSKRVKLFRNSDAATDTTNNTNNATEEIHYPHPTDDLVEINDSQVVFQNLSKKQLTIFKNSLDQIGKLKSTSTSTKGNKLLSLSITNSSENNINKGNSTDLNFAYKNINPIDVTECNLDHSNKKIITKNDNNISEIDEPLDINQITVPYSKSNTKRHFCIYCKKFQSKISRHLLQQHKKEDEVKRALAFPNKSKERMKIIDNIRKRGDFEHNTSAKHNTGVLIVSRQQQRKCKKIVDDYVCCKICKGFFSKNTIRKHNSRCGIMKGIRSTGIESRKLTQYIHTSANNILKAKIFPVLRVDEITKSIRYDELVIKFGNYLIESSYSVPQDDVIRQNLRLLGRFKIEMQKLEPALNELKEIYKSHLVGKCLKALRNIANWNENLMEFKVPTVAQHLASLIKQCGKRQRLELIKQSRENLKEEVENFLLLWDEEIPLINKIAFKSQTTKKASTQGRNKRCRRSNSESENISTICGDASDLVSENGSKGSTVESLILSRGKLISETRLISGISEYIQQDLAADISDNTNKTKDDTVNEIRAPLNINKIFLPNSRRTSKSQIGKFKSTSTITSQNELLSLSITSNSKNNINKENSTDLNPDNDNIFSVDVTECNLDNSKKSITEKDNITEVDGSLDINQILVPYSKISRKRHFCIFCKKLQSNISRHMLTKHKKEDEIKRALALPKTSKERMKIINNIRKRGDFEHNTSAKHNTGVLIVSRRQQSKYNKVVDDYVCCKSCMGFFSKNTIRIHKTHCAASKNSRSNGIDSRRLTQYIHTTANYVLKTKIFPVLRHDDITKSIRYDELVIKFGNYMIEKYSAKNQNDVVRQNLRLLGRFKIKITKLDSTITELKEIYKSHLVDKCIMAVRNVANWNETSTEFEVPRVAQNLTCLIQQCGKRHRAELIKEGRDDLKSEVEDFLLLWEEHFILINNKNGVESQSNQRRSYGKNKRCRRSNSESEDISTVSGVGSDLLSENGKLISDHKPSTTNISETRLRSGNVCDLISECIQQDLAADISDNTNKNKYDTVNETHAPCNINEILLPYFRRSSKRQIGKFKSTSTSTSHNELLSLSITSNSKNNINKENSTDLIPDNENIFSVDVTECNLDNSKNSITEKDNITEVDGSLDINQILVPYSKISTKKHFCIFCKKLQSNISRHMLTKHKKEDEIKRALALPKTSKERMKIINNIRKRGDFEHNTSAKHNTGVLIVSRRQQSKYNKVVDDYVCCKNCMGFFSKNTIRIHKTHCGASKNSRSNRIDSRKLTQYIHTAANYVLKTKIFPVLRHDDITKSIRYDELVIKFGNYMIEKYSAKNQNDVVRQNLRLLGRFKIEISKLNSTISELKEIYKSPLVDKCIMAIRNVASWNKTSTEFEVPTVAQNLTCLIKQCGKRHRAELIKEGRDDVRIEVEDFLLLWEEQFILINNKNGVESQSNQRTFSQRETKRCKWTIAEREAVTSIFGDLGRLKKLPSLEECSNAIRESHELSKRTAPQLKSWIDNQRRYKLA